MSGRVLEYWFEFASTYSHIATQRIEGAASVAGVRVEWRPFLLGPIFKSQGWDTSPFNIQRAKGEYMWRDIARECEKHGIPFRKPSQFPRNGLFAARVATAAETAPYLPAFVRSVYLANFSDDCDINDARVLSGLLTNAGCPDVPALLEAATSAATKERLRARTDEAIARGVFGAPSFFVGSELFWGNDRLEDAIVWASRCSGGNSASPERTEADESETPRADGHDGASPPMR
jgi:2-hydroxychromene-2-carboxylate isomerase